MSSTRGTPGSPPSVDDRWRRPARRMRCDTRQPEFWIDRPLREWAGQSARRDTCRNIASARRTACAGDRSRRPEKTAAVTLESLQQLDRLGSGNAVGIVGIFTFVGEPAQCGPEQPGPEGEDAIVNVAIASARVDCQVPRAIVVEARGADVVRYAIVIRPADARCEPPLSAKELRHRDGVRQALAKVGRIRVLRRGWVGHHTGDVGRRPVRNDERLGPAERELRVGPLEPHPARRQLVDVGGADGRAVNPEVVVQVVGDKEQHVRPRRLCRDVAPVDEQNREKRQAAQRWRPGHLEAGC